MKPNLTVIYRNSLFKLVFNEITNKKMITLIFILLFSELYSQEIFLKLPETKNNYPTVIINNNIISSEAFIKKNEDFITKTIVMKDKPNKLKHKFYNLTENGIVFIELDKKIKSKTQCELNNFFGLNKKNKIYVNGYLIEDSNYEISTESIIKVELVLPNSTNKLKHKSINVLTSENKRH